jgi:hypothetical protein
MNRLFTILLIALLTPLLSRVVISKFERVAHECLDVTAR